MAESLKTWLEARLKELPEKFELTSAINYGLSRWNAFSLFLDDPAVAIDNNAAERAIRPLVIGRRNWTFAGSDRGAENAATIMTIIETAKLCGLNPQTYIADLLNRLPDSQNQPTRRLGAVELEARPINLTRQGRSSLAAYPVVSGGLAERNGARVAETANHRLH